MLWVKMSLGDLKDWIMVSDTFNITALIIWIVRTIIYIFFIGIKQTVYIKPMITRVPVSISMGTRGTRELLMSLLVEALHWSNAALLHAGLLLATPRPSRAHFGDR